MVAACLTIIFLSLLCIIRSEVVSKVMDDQLELMLEASLQDIRSATPLSMLYSLPDRYRVYDSGPSFYTAVFDLTKWTRQQFYGDKP